MSYFRPNSSEGIDVMVKLRREIDAYDNGKRNAHYPMPAIIYDVVIEPNHVTIWNDNECVSVFYNFDYVI